jgi:Ser/Thr protein kinase RdoA (MazF antagonist)
VAERTLLYFQGFRFAVFPWHRGRAFDFDASDVLERLGRLLGRMHAIGRRARFRSRPAISVQRLGFDAVRLVAASPLLPLQWAEQYSALSAQLLEAVARVFDEVQPVSTLRLHGDCHLGNLLLDDGAPLFVDLDDCAQGPAIQDLWMLLSGSPDEQQGSWEKLMAGYEAFATFDYRELRLIEPLRALRMLHHTAWIVSRWQDPAFPRAFPSVVESRFWETHLQQLREQLAQLAEPPMLAR